MLLIEKKEADSSLSCLVYLSKVAYYRCVYFPPKLYKLDYGGMVGA